MLLQTKIANITNSRTYQTYLNVLGEGVMHQRINQNIQRNDQQLNPSELSEGEDQSEEN